VNNSSTGLTRDGFKDGNSAGIVGYEMDLFGAVDDRVAPSTWSSALYGINAWYGSTQHAVGTRR